MYLCKMHPKEIKNAVREKFPVFIAFGAIEYHGEHLPLGVDLLIAEGILSEIEKRFPIVIAPSIPVSPTMHWAGGAEEGDMDFSGYPLLEYVREYLRRLLEYGFDCIYVMLGHQGLDGDPGTIIKRAYWEITEEETRKFGVGWGRNPESIPGAQEVFSRVRPVLYDEFCRYKDEEEHLPVGHAGKGETQLIQALYPELAKLDRLSEQKEPWPQWMADVKEANAEQGRFWVNFCVDAWVSYLNTRRKNTDEEE